MEITARGFLGEGDIGHIRPGLHGQYGLCFLLGVELAEPGDPMFVHGRVGSRSQEGVGEVDLAVAIHVPIRGVLTQQVVCGLVNGERGFAIDREVTAAVILMAKAIDLRIGSTCLSRRYNSFVFYF